MSNKQLGGYYNYINLINNSKRLQIETKYELIKVIFFPQFFIVKDVIIKNGYHVLVLIEETGDNILLFFIKETDSSLISFLKIFFYEGKESSEFTDIDELDSGQPIYFKSDFAKLREKTTV